MSDANQAFGGVQPIRTDLFTTNMLRTQLQAAASLVEQCSSPYASTVVHLEDLGDGWTVATYLFERTS